MSNSDRFDVEGTVVDIIKGGKFKVRINDTDSVIECVTSGRLKQNFIRIIVGDKVTVSMSSYDLSKGIITWRDK